LSLSTQEALFCLIYISFGFKFPLVFSNAFQQTLKHPTAKQYPSSCPGIVSLLSNFYFIVGPHCFFGESLGYQEELHVAHKIKLFIVDYQRSRSNMGSKSNGFLIKVKYQMFIQMHMEKSSGKSPWT
jgi:hypothetical protein